MPLLCQLGRHSPEPLARWNDGYYFTRCRRCGSDLVRPLYGRWQVPRGFRVVWQPRPPKSHMGAQLVRDAGGSGAASGTRRSNAPVRAELPIAEVLRHLHGEELDRNGIVQQPNGVPEPQDKLAEVAPSESAEPWGAGTETHQAIENDRLESAGALDEVLAEPPGDQPEPEELASDQIVVEADEAVVVEPPEPEPDAETDIDQPVGEPEPEAEADIGQPGGKPEPEAQPEAETPTATEGAAGGGEVSAAEPDGVVEAGAGTEAEAEVEPPEDQAEAGETETGFGPDNEPESDEPGGRRSVVPDFMSDSSPETDWLFIPTPSRLAQVEPDPAIETEVSGNAPLSDEETPSAVTQADTPVEAPIETAVETPPTEAEADAPVEAPIQAPVQVPTAAVAATPVSAPNAAVESQPASLQAGADPSPVDRIRHLAVEMGDSLSALFARFMGWVRGLRLDAILRPEGDEQPSLTPTGMLLAISLPFLFLISVLLLSSDPPPTESAGRAAERPAAAPTATASTASTGAEPAFVTASLLNCRSAPARQAPPVRRLARGESIEILALDGEWASIAARGEQCWVLTRYISTARPALGLASSGGAQSA